MSAPSQPNHPSRPSFQVKLTGPDGSKIIELSADELLVGRGAQAQVVVSHEEVSRRHFKILMRAGRVYVTDEGSRNGTFVDGLRLESGKPQLWSEGQVIRLGLAPHALTLEQAPASHQGKGSHPIQAPQDFRAPQSNQDKDPSHTLSEPAPIARRTGGLTPVEGTQVEVELAEGENAIPSQEEEHAALTRELDALHLEVADLKLQRQRIKEELEHLTQAREDLKKLLSQELEELEEGARQEIQRLLEAAKALLLKAKDEARLIKEDALRVKSAHQDEPVEETKTSSGLIAEDPNGKDEAVTSVRDVPSAQAWLAQIRMPPGARKITFLVAPLVVLMGLGLISRGLYLRWAQSSSGQGEWASQASDLEGLQSRVNLTQAPVRHRFTQQAQAFLVSELKLKPLDARSAIDRELSFLGQVTRHKITSEGLLEHKRSMEQLLGSPLAYNKFIGFQSDFLREKR